MTDTELTIAFLILLGLFSLVFTGLAASTLLNVLRLRNKRLHWEGGKMKGYPLFSTIFLVFTMVLMGVGLYQESRIELLASFLYLLLGTGWFITSYLASKRYITDHGIVKNVNEPSQTVAWHQIRDFVEHEQEKDGEVTFVFIYNGPLQQNANSNRTLRLELRVPESDIQHFKKLISHKLGRRINCSSSQTVKLEHFK